MPAPAKHSPFKPGAGRPPPYLAGREPEQSLFREYLAMLRDGETAPGEIVVYGPRGNGKTALLRWVEREAAANELDAYWLTGDDIPEPADLIENLQLNSWLEKIAPESVSVGGVGVSLRRSGKRPPLAQALEARAKVKPLLVLLDEAHVLEPKVGRWILNAAQRAGTTAPFLLVLAGTPDLRARLSEMGASFWNRSRKIPLGRLEEPATTEAIRRPLADNGITIEDEALEHIVRESHGYPFFVQLWGQAVWGRIRGASPPSAPVTVAIVEDAAGEFEAERNDYYLDRFDELEQRGLLPAAREVALAFRDRPRLPHAEFREAIRRVGSGGDRSFEFETATATALVHLGFVWKTRGAKTWEPGIPSLMNYVLEYEPPPGGADAGGR